MEANFVQIGNENYINLMNVARVRFTDSSAEVFYTGGQSESITDPYAIENLRQAIGAKSEVPRKTMEVAQPIMSARTERRG